MINLEELIYDEDFCKGFKIIRKTTADWSKGEPVVEEEEFEVEGHVAPTSSKDLKLLPEGDRREGLKTFYTESKIPMHLTNTEKTSDVCVYKGRKYKLIKIFDYEEHGFWKAIGTLAGEVD